MPACPYCGRDYEETIDSMLARSEYETDLNHTADLIIREQGIDHITAIEMAKRILKNRGGTK